MLKQQKKGFTYFLQQQQNKKSSGKSKETEKVESSDPIKKDYENTLSQLELLAKSNVCQQIGTEFKTKLKSQAPENNATEMKQVNNVSLSSQEEEVKDPQVINAFDLSFSKEQS